MDVNSTALNSSSNNDTFAGPVFPAYIRPAATVLCSLVMGIGILGNVMVLLVIFKSKDMRSSTNIFLMNLSVADLMVLLVCTPTALVEVHSKPDTWVLGEEMCKAVPFIETTVSHASVLTILAISFERYYAICEPLKAGYVCTKTRACMICVCAWAIAALLTSPLLVIPEYGPKEYIDGTTVMTCLLLVNTLWSQWFFYISISLFFWLPFLVLVMLYSVIAFRLMADPGLKGNETFNYRARRQLVLMLGTVVILFFLCLMPFRVFILWHIAVPGPAVRELGVEKYFNILYFCRIMFYANSAVNPILYNLMSSKFRDGFFKLCSVHRRTPIITFTELVYDGADPVCLTSANTAWSEFFFLGTTAVFFALPLLILVILYSIIANSLMASPGIVAVTRQDSTTSTLRYRKQVVLMIFTVVVFFFTCMLPFRALVVYVVVVPHEQIGEALGNEGYFPLLYFCRVMFYVNSAVNPILYNLMSSKFRSGFVKLCGLKSNCLRKHTRALLRTSTFNTSTLTAITNSSIHRSSLFESLNRSKPSSLHKNNSTKSSQRSSISNKYSESKDIVPKCHFRLAPIWRERRRSSFSGAKKTVRLPGLQRSHSSDSYFRISSKGLVKSSIKFVHRDESSISKPLVTMHQCHSILKKHTARSTNTIVRKPSQDDEIFYNYQLIPTCIYVLNRADVMESFV